MAFGLLAGYLDVLRTVSAARSAQAIEAGVAAAQRPRAQRRRHSVGHVCRSPVCHRRRVGIALASICLFCARARSGSPRPARGSAGTHLDASPGQTIIWRET